MIIQLNCGLFVVTEFTLQYNRQTVGPIHLNKEFNPVSVNVIQGLEILKIMCETNFYK